MYTAQLPTMSDQLLYRTGCPLNARTLSYSFTEFMSAVITNQDSPQGLSKSAQSVCTLAMTTISGCSVTAFDPPCKAHNGALRWHFSANATALTGNKTL